MVSTDSSPSHRLGCRGGIGEKVLGDLDRLITAGGRVHSPARERPMADGTAKGGVLMGGFMAAEVLLADECLAAVTGMAGCSIRDCHHVRQGRYVGSSLEAHPLGIC